MDPDHAAIPAVYTLQLMKGQALVNLTYGGRNSLARRFETIAKIDNSQIKCNEVVILKL